MIEYITVIKDGLHTGIWTAKQVAYALDLKTNDRVLEIGCGVGRIGREFALYVKQAGFELLAQHSDSPWIQIMVKSCRVVNALGSAQRVEGGIVPSMPSCH